MSCTQCAFLPATLAGLVGWRHFHTSAPCWWLVREVLRQHRGLVLPAANVLAPKRDWGRLVDAHRHEWAEISTPAAYDAVLCRAPRRLDHIGLYERDGRMIHLPRGAAGVARTALEVYRQAGYDVRCYRYLGP